MGKWNLILVFSSRTAAPTLRLRSWRVLNWTFSRFCPPPLGHARDSGMEVADPKRFKELEEENRRLKQMYADPILNHKVLKDIVEKKR